MAMEDSSLIGKMDFTGAGGFVVGINMNGGQALPIGRCKIV